MLFWRRLLTSYKNYLQRFYNAYLSERWYKGLVFWTCRLEFWNDLILALSSNWGIFILSGRAWKAFSSKTGWRNGGWNYPARWFWFGLVFWTCCRHDFWNRSFIFLLITVTFCLWNFLSWLFSSQSFETSTLKSQRDATMPHGVLVILQKVVSPFSQILFVTNVTDAGVISFEI